MYIYIYIFILIANHCLYISLSLVSTSQDEIIGGNHRQRAQDSQGICICPGTHCFFSQFTSQVKFWCRTSHSHEGNEELIHVVLSLPFYLRKNIWKGLFKWIKISHDYPVYILFGRCGSFNFSIFNFSFGNPTQAIHLNLQVSIQALATKKIHEKKENKCRWHIVSSVQEPKQVNKTFATRRPSRYAPDSTRLRSSSKDVLLSIWIPRDRAFTWRVWLENKPMLKLVLNGQRRYFEACHVRAVCK